MFHFLGVLVSRFWPVWLIGWLAVLGVLYVYTPPWLEVAQDREFSFLPEEAPSRQGTALLKRAFPDELAASNIVLVITRADSELLQEDRAFIKDHVKPAFLRLADEEGGLATPDAPRASIIVSVRTLDDPGYGGLLISADRQSTLVVVDLTTELLEHRNWPVVARVESLIAGLRQEGKVPTGLDISLIGSATVGRDLTMGQRRDSDATEFWTIAIVVTILLVIYRAPLMALIPLVSVFVATEVALKLLSHLARLEIITLFEGVQIFITVILYGAGVDYCLFLIARYQEERQKGADWGDALSEAVAKVGPALTASAATVTLGVGMMVFAQFGKFHHAGVAVSLSLFLALCTVLTFTTALLRLTGRWAFWPRVPKMISDVAPAESTSWHARFGRCVACWFSWDALALALMRRPVLIWTVTVLIMSPLVAIAVARADQVDYDFVRRLPPDAPSVAGSRALQEHFPAGIAGTITVLIHHPDAEFHKADSKSQLQLQTFTARLRQQYTRLQLADIRGLAQPLGITTAARYGLTVPVEDLDQAMQDAVRYYVSMAGPLEGQVTRLELTMTALPLSREGIVALNKIEETIRAELPGELRQSKVYFLGTTADMRDLRSVTGSDQQRIQVLVVIAVLAVLLVLLRRPVVSLYLIVSVLFSYFATLGATFAFFNWIEGDAYVGLDWKTPVFLFTILVAVGEDYNIFLMSRVAEEQAGGDLVEGVRVALVKTGRIITSCGLIMAGTFASMLSGQMQDLQHLGFALAFGVLLDTFVVRPILVPAFLIVLERGRTFWIKLSALVASSYGERGA